MTYRCSYCDKPAGKTKWQGTIIGKTGRAICEFVLCRACFDKYPEIRAS